MIKMIIWTAEHPNVIVPCEKFIDMVVTHNRKNRDFLCSENSENFHNGKFYEGMLTEVEQK